MREKSKPQGSHCWYRINAVQLHPDNEWGIVVEDASDGAADSLVCLSPLVTVATRKFALFRVQD
jgi:hypothetical protein